MEEKRKNLEKKLIIMMLRSANFTNSIVGAIHGKRVIPIY